MATTQKWVAPTQAGPALTTELNSLTNGALSAASAAYDNSANLFQYISFELVLTSLTPTGTPACYLYLIESLDGTNYEDLTTSATHAQKWGFPMSTATAAKRISSGIILLPPFKVKVALLNQAGPTLAASGNALTPYVYNEQSV